MASKKIVLTHKDYEKLSLIVENFRKNGKLREPHLIKLAEELKTAVVLDDAMIPSDIVLINSRVQYTDLNNNETREADIVFPANNDLSDSKISIFAPVGTGLIGEKEGSIIDCKAPAGNLRLRVDKILGKAEIRN